MKYLSFTFDSSTECHFACFWNCPFFHVDLFHFGILCSVNTPVNKSHILELSLYISGVDEQYFLLTDCFEMTFPMSNLCVYGTSIIIWSVCYWYLSNTTNIIWREKNEWNCYILHSDVGQLCDVVHGPLWLAVFHWGLLWTFC